MSPTQDQCHAPDSPVAPSAKSRLEISDSAKDGMKGAVKVATLALGMTAQATQNIPYLGAISTALTEFMKIQDEVDQCKDECKATMAHAKEMKRMVERFRDKCIESGRGEGALNTSLRDAFSELEEIVLECILTLQKCKVDPKRKRDRVRLYLKRSDLAKSVKECSSKLAKAVQQFNTTLQVDQVIILEDMRLTLNNIRETQTSGVSQVKTPVVSSKWRLRAANSIFHGREAEVKTAVDLFTRRAPARVAVLGPGGIGKTSVALAILHDPAVRALYDDRRCFMSCEATTTADAVVRSLADALGGSIADNSSFEAACHRLFSQLETMSGIICLDNLETPLDADKPALEVLLNEIAALPSIALLITSRDTSIPTIKWTSPPLPHIQPFSPEAALATWDDICDQHDEYAMKLVDAVDSMPLAVTLLARMAAVEGSAKRIWDRWEKEHIDLVRTGGKKHRLYSVAESIDLSLRALSDRNAVIDVLCIICLFPEGLWEGYIPRLESAFRDHSMSVSHYLAELRQFSLIYVEEPPRGWLSEITRFYTLSPIRHHILQHYLSDDMFITLADHAVKHSWASDGLWELGLGRIGPCRDHCLRLAMLQPSRIDQAALLLQALDETESRGLEPRTQANILRQLGLVLSKRQGGLTDARAMYERAVRIHEQLGEKCDLFSDWVEWIRTCLGESDENGGLCEPLEDMQGAISTAWRSGRDASIWGSDGSLFNEYRIVANAQHMVNEERRRLDMSIIHRSGLYSDSTSTANLHAGHGFWGQEKECFIRLLQESAPPWDLALILETHRTLGHVRTALPHSETDVEDSEQAKDFDAEERESGDGRGGDAEGDGEERTREPAKPAYQGGRSED
ncbi:unnamed protein product [Peniophora sp. CBMAI 1063]|nr:unnamed protein product [Peniophora sp. CBMAI 1063]